MRVTSDSRGADAGISGWERGGGRGGGNAPMSEPKTIRVNKDGEFVSLERGPDEKAGRGSTRSLRPTGTVALGVILTSDEAVALGRQLLRLAGRSGAVRVGRGRGARPRVPDRRGCRKVIGHSGGQPSSVSLEVSSRPRDSVPAAGPARVAAGPTIRAGAGDRLVQGRRRTRAVPGTGGVGARSVRFPAQAAGAPR